MYGKCSIVIHQAVWGEEAVRKKDTGMTKRKQTILNERGRERQREYEF